eukprot:scaffold323_cov414-Prasinococcus_capsulatus_cf.AAC.29
MWYDTPPSVVHVSPHRSLAREPRPACAALCPRLERTPPDRGSQHVLPGLTPWAAPGSRTVIGSRRATRSNARLRLAPIAVGRELLCHWWRCSAAGGGSQQVAKVLGGAAALSGSRV